MTTHSENIYPFTIGNFKCFAINDGVSTYASAAFMFDKAPQAELEESLGRTGEQADSIACANTCLVIETGTHRILIDTGGGRLSQWGPPAADLGQLPQHLASLNMPPEAFDFIVFTHLHRDHVLGCLQIDSDIPMFPQSRHVVQRTEWETLEDDRKAPLQCLQPHLEFVDGSAAIAPGVEMILSPGHSMGHSSIRIHSQGSELICLGDIVAHPFHLENPDWTMGNEPDQSLAIETRRKALKDAVAGGHLVHAYHMPFPSLAMISKGAKGFLWEPISS